MPSSWICVLVVLLVGGIAPSSAEERLLPLTSCAGAPAGTGCDDQNACTVNDSCWGGQCMAGAPGTFVQAPGSPIPVGRGPGPMAVADFNRDGRQDLAVLDVDSLELTVLIGEGPGAFSEAPGSPVPLLDLGSYSGSLTTADFNRDGNPDLAMTNCNPDVKILLGDGTGAFTESTLDIYYCYRSIAAGDFNLDGKPDLVGASALDGDLSILLGDGNGGFVLAAGSPQPTSSPWWVAAVGKFNADGWPDVAVISRDHDQASIFLGDGAGGLALAPGSPVPVSDSPESVAVADFNLDGIDDLAVPSFGPQNVVILTSDGTGRLTPAAGSPVLLDAGPWSIAAGDFSLDGRPDLAVAGCDPILSVLLGDGTGRFTAAALSPVPGSGCQESLSIAVGEFSRDGRPDLAVANNGVDQVTVLLGNQGRLDCDDGDPCTADACAAATGCAHTPIPDGGACEDGNLCTTGDACFGGSCVSGPPRVCNDGTRCTADACDPARGCTFAPIPGGACACSRYGLCTAAQVASFRVVDVSGDHDGVPDTNETFDLYLSIRNHLLDEDLTDLTLELATEDPKIDCVPVPSVAIPSIPAGGTVETPVPFRLHVSASADRGGTVPPATCAANACSNGAGPCSSAVSCAKTVTDDYSAKLSFRISSHQYGLQPDAQSAVVDLDLELAQPSVSTSTFVEGFEGGLGTFQLQTLDSGMATNALSDGTRCQFNDPDSPNSSTYGDPYCYLGFAAGQSPVNDWHQHTTSDTDGGRAFLGSRSLHYGTHVPDTPMLDNYSFSQMDAVRTKAPVNLAARICAFDGSSTPRACNLDSDCAAVGGGPCVSASPVLSFKQQISLADSRYLSMPPGQVLDRAVVHAQISSSPVWQKLYPFQNVYDSQGSDIFTNCRFDPTDDGNTEDDYFDPADPARRYGPSSTCFPEFVFGQLGQASLPYSAKSIGRASDGPGLRGSLGVGTWVESRFDLSRYRGRAIRLRFLFTSIKDYDFQNYDVALNIQPLQGWYLDDVRVTQTLGTASPTATVDHADNGALPSCVCAGAAACDDADPCTVDACDPASGCSHLPPASSEVSALTFADLPEKDRLVWAPHPSAASYDVLRGAIQALPVGPGGADEQCFTGIVGTTWVDQTTTSGGVYYLVRGRNGACAGSWGVARRNLPGAPVFPPRTTACP